MGRRKKEPEGVHRERIASAASALFMHKSIAEASKNKVIAAFILSIHSTFTEHQNRVSARAQIADQVNKLHLEIVEALKKRDQKLAKTLMYEHLQMVEDSLSSVISAQKGS
mgnify:CR=1 FL=1